MSHLTHFQELTILPDPEISAYFIWQKLYTQLHIALADVKNEHGIDSIGVSFPDYYYDPKEKKSRLGKRLRIFAPNSDDLVKLQINKWLNKLKDYVDVGFIEEVGNKPKGHLLVRRYRYRDITKVAREFAEHKGIDFAAALKHCQTHKRPPKAYPFINLKSETTKQPYKLSVWQTKVDNPVTGTFNSYGLNTMTTNVTVPHW